MILAHEIRIQPTRTQEQYFRRAAGTARFAYNWALEQWNRQYRDGEKPSAYKLKKHFNSLRRSEYPWSYEVHRDCTARAFDNLQTAFQRFFRKQSRYPRFKKRGQRDSFYIANDKLQLKGRKARIPVLGWIRLREQLRFQGKVIGATVKRVADMWFLVVQVRIREPKPRTADGVVGIDLGLESSVTLSSGEKLQGPRPLKRSLDRLRRLSRSLSRKSKGSNNWKRAVLRLSRLHYRISCQRKDFLHKTTTRICRENQAVAMESLGVKEMMRGYLARAIADQGWGEFARQIRYKAELYQCELTLADRFFPSTQKCSQCSELNQISLAERTYHCAACGAVIDRDLNAALNLKQLWQNCRLGSQSKQEHQGAHLCAPGR